MEMKDQTNSVDREITKQISLNPSAYVIYQPQQQIGTMGI